MPIVEFHRISSHPPRTSRDGLFLARCRDDVGLLASYGFILAAASSALFSGGWIAAIVALSFWHYYLYWLALQFRTVRPDVFRRDTIFMKSVSIAAFATVYLAAPLDWVSLAVIAAGGSLNVCAAAALGGARTYYGVELGAVAPRKISSFPYSLTAHPMLYGNMAAFAGTLLNAEFRADWWPLALAHVCFNAGLLVLETQVTPSLPRVSRRFATLIALGAASMGACLGYGVARASGAGSEAFAFGLGAAAGLYAFCLYTAYSEPRPQTLTTGRQA